MNEYKENYFKTAQPSILDNKGLRRAQKDAYIKICNHFLLDKSKNHAVAILPTGAGKTGVMGLAPYGISRGRVLIITPQLVIKDHVLDSLDPSSPDNFWLKHGVFEDYSDLPKVVEYDKETFMEELEESNIVILNIHKLSTRYRNSLLKKVESDFFDMIIIDEAHHSPAETWSKALEYFKDAKVLKVTGTPFRTDRKQIEGQVIMNYRLGKAMKEGIVKTLKNFVLKPEKVYLTLNGDESKKYTLKEFELLNIKEKDYISKSVAMSKECNQQIVNASIEQLNERLSVSDVPHKIIAVCCSIKHAEKVKLLYEESNLRVVVVHSKLPKNEKIEALRKIESHQTDVVIHVAMLGEGYDHPYLSVAAIFRPYRSLAPYSQFIGRILRRIPDQVTANPIDNIGTVVAHRDLGLDPLWKEYMQEKRFCEVLEAVIKNDKKESKLINSFKKEETDLGQVIFDGEIDTEEEYYEFTSAAEAYEAYEKDIEETVEKLKSIFPDKSEKELSNLARKEKAEPEFNPLLKNPKKYRNVLREGFNEKVQYEIPAQLILEFDLTKEGIEFKNLPLQRVHQWTLQKPDNTAIIAAYLNSFFKNKYGERKNWVVDDYLNANKDLDAQIEYLRILIRGTLKKES
ncbi:DEAD/DEAH box helicase [Bacillus velezensis]|uniref:DEAD/DEAH box helicase n=1 Tax=Bacillus velezensis TaxID=492670 RepID=UPI00285A8531|nr:DEAD/DEAH box helicase family protein [Bacillus velezensis]MDR7909368.1 DEAD/DEAH box helicase family protein [Bacillus velezensis]